MKMFGTNGIRGIANDFLSPELALRVGRAAAFVLGPGAIAVARDPRTSSDMIASSVEAGLMSAGVDVDDLGMETAALAPKLGRRRSRRYHRAFLNDHRHDVVLPVDGHVGRDAVGNEEIGDGVLAELVKNLLLLRVGVPIALQQGYRFARILEVVGYQFQFLLLEEF